MSWKFESKRHSLASRGIKTAQQINEQMIKAVETRWKNRIFRERPPSLKVMADFIEKKYPSVKVEIKNEGFTTGRQSSSGVYYSKSYHTRKTAKIIDKKTGDVLYNHNPSLHPSYTLSKFAEFVIKDLPEKLKKREKT